MSKTGNQIKTGSYAVTTVYSMPWSKKTSNSGGNNRKKADKKVVHPIFEQCAEITTDPYWVSVLKDCARDKLPRGFFYKNGLITHRRGNKINRILVPSAPHEALSLCISFFKSSAGLMSTIDRKRIRKEEEERILETLTVEHTTWKDIKTDKVKELLISEFIADLTQRSDFTKDAKSDLITTVKTGFMLKYFNHKNIIMKNGRIGDITGLRHDKETNKYYIDPKLTVKKPTRKAKGLGIETQSRKPKVSFISLWEKYIMNMEKSNGPESNFRVIGSSKSNSDSNSGELFSGSGETPLSYSLGDTI